jgi:hypothetical protein
VVCSESDGRQLEGDKQREGVVETCQELVDQLPDNHVSRHVFKFDRVARPLRASQTSLRILIRAFVFGAKLS